MTNSINLYTGLNVVLDTFGSLHDTFYAVATQTLGATPVDRNLSNFKTRYRANISKARTELPVCDFQKGLLDFDTKHGVKLMKFADSWAQYLSAMDKDPRPRKSVKKDVITRIDDAVRRIDGDGTKSDAALAVKNLKVSVGRSAFQHVLAKLNNIEVRYDSNRNDYYNRNRTSTSTSYLLSPDSAKITLAEARELAEQVQTAEYDKDTMTWKKYVEVQGDDIFDVVDDVKEYMENVDGIYSVLKDPLKKTLKQAMVKASTRASELKNSASKEDLALAEKLEGYVKAILKLENVVLDAFVKPQKFDATEVKRLGMELAGTATDGSGWERATSFGSTTGLSTRSFYGTGTGTGTGTGKNFGKAPSAPFLHRAIDVDRVEECRKLADNFLASLSDVDSTTATNLKNSNIQLLSEFDAKIEALDKTDEAYIQRDGLLKQKANVVHACLTRIRGVMSRHRDRHTTFALRQNRGALRYMTYWQRIPAVSSRTTAYFQKLDEATKKGADEIRAILKSAQELLKGGDSASASLKGIKDVDIESILDQKEALEEYARLAIDKIAAVHRNPSTFIDQLTTDTHAKVIYFLKAVRFALAWMALSISTKAFTSMYNSRVYVKNVDPPTPLLFVAMFVGIDLALNAGLLTLLWCASRLFKSSANDFPIDGYLLTAWSVDLAFSEVVLALLSVVLAQIVYTKKAFRYRQEGDRGIRALGQMMLYSYAVLLFVPFFRIV